jgi:phosphate uptake regulator
MSNITKIESHIAKQREQLDALEAHVIQSRKADERAIRLAKAVDANNRQMEELYAERQSLGITTQDIQPDTGKNHGAIIATAASLVVIGLVFTLFI